MTCELRLFEGIAIRPSVRRLAIAIRDGKVAIEYFTEEVPATTMACKSR
jgi:hypothetical protein